MERPPIEELKAKALEILSAALKAVDPAEAIKRHVRVRGTDLLVEGAVFDLSRTRRIYVVGAGKASAPMAAALEGLLRERISTGLLSTKYGYLARTERIRLVEAGHPLPDRAGLKAAEAIFDLVKGAGEDDLVIALLSGGGSALLPLPVEGVSLEEKEELTRLLLYSGATIKEINTVRKHLSRIKGGQLARAAFPAKTLGLILSDVVGDPVDVIASGPTAPDPTTFVEAWGILEKYGLHEKAPASIRHHLRLGCEGKIPETPKPEEPIFQQVLNLIVGSNLLALLAAKAKAEALGFHTLILSSTVEGEAREAAKVHGAIAREVRRTGNPLPPPACLLSGGETTVTVKGGGKGGRNQEFALAAAFLIEDLPSTVILSCDTDGSDGPTGAAGAIVSGETLRRARNLGLDPLRALMENDTYPFFEKLGDLIITGPTNTNVMDFRLILIGPESSSA